MVYSPTGRIQKLYQKAVSSSNKNDISMTLKMHMIF